MPTGYVLLFFWTLVAIGGALCLGTGAALVRYARTGRVPGDPGGQDAAPSRKAVRQAFLRCLLGLTVAAGGATGVLSGGG